MRNKIARGLLFLSVGALAVGGRFGPAFAQSRANAQPTAAQEKEACIKNLKRIYEAIQAYQTDNKALPNWLSDLVPKYLDDANVLICPVCRRTGKTEKPPLADPKIPCSYLFEFCPVRLGKSLPRAPNRTRREWKRRQMGLLGSVVPIVRCRFHNPVLNVAFDGKIYESPPKWEMAFTNRVPASELTAAALFASDLPAAAKGHGKGSRKFPERDPKTPKELLDLSGFYNAMLNESWYGGTNNNLAALPEGVHAFGGIDFDVRGIVQLRGSSPPSTNFPLEIKGIRVRQKCHHLYFLHAAGFGAVTDEGKQVAAYVIHYATNQMRLEVPVIYGQDVRNWHLLPDEPPGGKDLKVVWVGDNGESRRLDRPLRLFVSTWANPVPDFEVDSLDFVSRKANPAPFLIAITAD